MNERGKPAVGFVGVGRMGANMALRLRDVGYPIVAVYDAAGATAQKIARDVGARRRRRCAA